MNRIQVAVVAILLSALSLTALGKGQDPAREAASADSQALLMSYRRLLPLEGGSNFRDLGGYPTSDGHAVKRGLLFRSGAMTGLTERDIEYLGQFGFQAVVDLRSREERDLYPNPWIAVADLEDRYHDYSMVALMKQAAEKEEGAQSQRDYSRMYPFLAEMIKPQLGLYFDALLNERTPVVVNCSAGQDRTGIASAIVLTLLGVDRELVIEDYLLSTDFRRPGLEAGNVDLEEAAKTNEFAAMMLHYGAGSDMSRPNPLVTGDGVPFIVFALDAIEERYGSVAAFAREELGMSQDQQAKLRDLYLD